VNGNYAAPMDPGTSAEIRRESIENWTFPDGPGWAQLRATDQVQ